MPAKPPPIPALAYERVIKVARFDGYFIMLLAGVGALAAAAGGDVIQCVAACFAAGTGAMEIHGSRMLRDYDEDGVNWLVSAQLLLMLVIVAYAIYRITHFDMAWWRATFEHSYDTFLGPKHPLTEMVLSDPKFPQLCKLSNVFAFGCLGIVTCLYQGMMARYYFRSRAAIAQALDEMC